jgi:beta-lactamase superfamily II metal-dependent hydrolase
MAELLPSKYNIGYQQVKYAFAEYPSIKVYKSHTGKVWGNHLLFGDYIKIKDTEIKNGRVPAYSRGSTGWVNVADISAERILEVNFVDIGQGDGCHIVTPDNQQILVDAGKTDNMARYLTWRFNLYGRKTPLPFGFKVVISHSDADHYNGFSYVFGNDKIPIDAIYHNCLVERPGTKPLGTVEDGHITGLVRNTLEMLEIITDQKNLKGTRSTYCKTLYKVLKHYPTVPFKGLTIADECLDGFDVTNKVYGKKNSIKILGPLLSKTNGKDSLKSINNLGKDKNGHSVIMKYTYDKVRILLGGDVNTEFGEMLHTHYKKTKNLKELKVDVAKACHHGSNHFHYEFLKKINAAATVISSGDDESYAHPRPDAIGALGKCGYGDKPLVFSTELARSNKEMTYKNLLGVAEMFGKLAALRKELDATTDEVEKGKIKIKILKVNKEINSFITKFGMINVRTDGRRMIIAQKYERESGSGKWDIHKFEYHNTKRRFVLQEA